MERCDHGVNPSVCPHCSREVHVRIGLILTPDGVPQAAHIVSDHGRSHLREDAMREEYGARFIVITADVPLPEEVTVEGKVEER